MTAVREKNIIEFNEIFTNPESQSESDTETDCESDIGENSESNTDTLDEPETSEYSDPNVESPPEVSDDEDVPSSCSSICTSRLWTKSNFKPKLFQFQNNDCGIVCDLNGESPLDFFKLYFDEKLIHIIIDETNKFQVNSSDKHISSSSHQAKWIPTDFEEMYLFLATFMLMAHMKKFRIKDYWSTDPLIATPIFGDIMPRDRFLLLLKFLHFNDNTYQPEGDRSYKIKPVVQDLKQKFRRVFVPYQNLCIDESLVLHKGRLSFKQYIPSKRSRFGIKLFVLCYCHTGYILDFVIYMGSATEIHHRKELGIPGSIVMTLMQPYLQKGHNLFMDNWYSSPILFEELHANSTGACRTVRQNRLGMPHFTDTLQKGGTDYRNTNILFVIKWFDKREVTILSTIHEAKMMNTGKVHWKTNEQIQKPASVIAYNTNMGSVDRSSMQISCVECIRKTTKWYKKLFFHFMDLSVFNSFVLYKQKTHNNIRLHEFRLQLIRQIIEMYGKSKAPRGRPSYGENPNRLIGRHFPSLIPSTATRENPRKQCVVCANTTRRAKKRAVSRYECPECNVGLCITGCFRDYHMLKYF